MNSKDSLNQIKSQFASSQKLILNSGEISSENSLNEEIIKYASSLGKKVEVGTVDDAKYGKKILSWGVNYITTKTLPSFLISNEKEVPIIVRCLPIDDEHSECEIKYIREIFD